MVGGWGLDFVQRVLLMDGESFRGLTGHVGRAKFPQRCRKGGGKFSGEALAPASARSRGKKARIGEQASKLGQAQRHGATRHTRNEIVLAHAGSTAEPAQLCVVGRKR